MKRHFSLLIAVFTTALLFVSCGGGGNTNATPTYTVGGTVFGLAGSGLVLQDNAGDDLTLSANEELFTFSAAVADGAGYNITVKTQPTDPAQTCTASNNVGTVAGANVTNVQVVCSTNTYSVGGTVSGLSGAGLVLQNNGGDNLAISSIGPFTFAAKLADGSGYNVTVKTQPTGQACTTGANTGTIAGANITNVTVQCAAAYTVTYNGNQNTSGTAPIDTHLYRQEDTVTVLGNTGSLVRLGWTFTGWNIAANGTGTAYSQGSTLIMSSANVTLYAQWAPTYTVTYNGNNNTHGTVPVGPTTYTPGQTVTVLGNTNSLSNLPFHWMGWNTQINGSGTSYSAGSQFTMPAADVTLYAQWSCLTYSPAGAYTTDMVALAGTCNIKFVEDQNQIAPMLITPNGDCRFWIADYQLLLAQGQYPWSFVWTNTFNACYNTGGCYLTFQSDGNLVVYDPNSNPVWASNTSGHPAAVLYLSPGVNTSGQTSCRITIFDGDTCIFIVP